jgi:hypothetical protein
LTGPTQITIKIRYKKDFLAIKESGNKQLANKRRSRYGGMEYR